MIYSISIVRDREKICLLVVCKVHNIQQQYTRAIVRSTVIAILRHYNNSISVVIIFL